MQYNETLSSQACRRGVAKQTHSFKGELHVVMVQIINTGCKLSPEHNSCFTLTHKLLVIYFVFFLDNIQKNFPKKWGEPIPRKKDKQKLKGRSLSSHLNQSPEVV